MVSVAASGARERGQSTVELVAVLPILVLGVLIVAQVARVAGDHVALHHATREAARQAALGPDPEMVAEAARAASPNLSAERVQVELGPERQRGQLIEIRVTYRSPTDVVLIGRLVGDVELSATAVVVIE